MQWFPHTKLHTKLQKKGGVSGRGRRTLPHIVG